MFNKIIHLSVDKHNTHPFNIQNLKYIHSMYIYYVCTVGEINIATTKKRKK